MAEDIRSESKHDQATNRSVEGQYNLSSRGTVSGTKYARSESASIAAKCKYRRDNGKQCGAYAMSNSAYCFAHDADSGQQREAARRKGGEVRSRRASVLSPDTPDHALTTAREVTDLLAKTINQVRRGELDSTIANSIGVLVGYLLKAQAQDQVERRLEKVELILNQKWANPRLALESSAEHAVHEFVKASLGGEA